MSDDDHTNVTCFGNILPHVIRYMSVTIPPQGTNCIESAEYKKIIKKTDEVLEKMDSLRLLTTMRRCWL